MQNRRDAGHCKTGGMKDSKYVRKGGIQERRDGGKGGYMTGGRMTEGMQDRRQAGIEL